MLNWKADSLTPYHDNVFRAVSNTDNEKVPWRITFYYCQERKLLHAAYSGGEILFGSLVGL
ncbi:hypothetical protein [Metabacillus arenae]|uniref:Uncharacterized protein n=1 Tax=Metabacillus arenae TaxID=2771434 RepID=A0A926RVQ9_9BACI|nr:hypothetical protein [Metabacillus arenae]MBD1378740.1 hypothetical protein [Metabacillus arenae]